MKNEVWNKKEERGMHSFFVGEDCFSHTTEMQYFADATEWLVLTLLGEICGETCTKENFTRFSEQAQQKLQRIVINVQDALDNVTLFGKTFLILKNDLREELEEINGWGIPFGETVTLSMEEAHAYLETDNGIFVKSVYDVDAEIVESWCTACTAAAYMLKGKQMQNGELKVWLSDANLDRILRALPIADITCDFDLIHYEDFFRSEERDMKTIGEQLESILAHKFYRRVYKLQKGFSYADAIQMVVKEISQ